MYFLIEDYDLLGKYDVIWYKVNVNIRKEIDGELVYNENYLKKFLR